MRKEKSCAAQQQLICREDFAVIAKIRHLFARAFALFGFSTDPEQCGLAPPPNAHWDATHTFVLHFRDSAGLFSNVCVPATWHMMLKSPSTVRLLVRCDHSDLFHDDILHDPEVCALSEHTIHLITNWDQAFKSHPVWLDFDRICQFFPDLPGGAPYARVDIYLSPAFDTFRNAFLQSMFARAWGRLALAESLEQRADDIWQKKGMLACDLVIGVHGRFSGHFFCGETNRDWTFNEYLDDLVGCLEEQVADAMQRHARVAVWISTHIQPMLDTLIERIRDRFHGAVMIAFNDNTERMQHNADWTESTQDDATLRQQAAEDTLLLARSDIVIGGVSNMMLYLAGRNPKARIVVPKGLQSKLGH